MEISSLANSLPGQEWIPLPNGMNVLGFGATSNRDGSNFPGSEKISALWWIFLNSGNTFHPFGIKYPVHQKKKQKKDLNSKHIWYVTLFI